MKKAPQLQQVVTKQAAKIEELNRKAIQLRQEFLAERERAERTFARFQSSFSRLRN